MLKKFLAAIAAFSVLATSSPTLAANRLNFYSGIIPPSQWYDLQQRYERLANGAFQTAIMGTGGNYQNLSVTPQTGLYVQVGPTNTSAVGSLYQFQADDAAAYPPSGPINNSYQLPPDPTLVTVQGTTLANGNPIGPLPVPGSNSQISLIECQVVTNDTGAVSTNFISQLGTLQSNTVNRDRADQISCQSKAGTPSASPTVPTVDTGYLAVAYVTIPSGTSTITSGMITASPSLGHAVMDGAASTQTIAGAKTFSQAVTAPSFIGDVPNKVFNVKTYGAIGNGTTDDTTAIQTAASAAVVGGGALYFPQGQYKISSPITLNLNGAGAAGGVRVYGAAGQARRSSSNGAIIEPTYASGDVFLVEQNQSNGAGGIIFDDFSVNRNANGSTTPTSGGTFHLSGAAVSVTVQDVTTNWDYNVFQVDNNIGQPDGGIWVSNLNSENVIDDAFSISNWVGSAGGLIVRDSYFGGRGNTSGGTFMSLNVPSGAQIDPFYIKDVDVEAFAKGMLVEGGNSGFIVDGFIDGLLIDNTAQDSAVRILTQGAGGSGSGSAVSRVKIVNSWFESTAPGVAVVDIEANGTNSSYMNGADEFIIANSNVNAGTSHGIVVAGGAADVLLNGNMIYANGDCGVFIGQAQHVTLNGNRIGDVYGSGNSKGVCVDPPSGKTATGITVAGNDLMGNSSTALFVDNSSGGTISGLSVTGNNMTGYATPVSFPGTVPVDSMFRGNKGYNTETSDATSTTTRFVHNALTSCSGSTLLSDLQNAGTSKWKADCSGNTTQAGTVNASSVLADVPNGVFNVKTYGATGNGTTDDTAAIQNAINALVANNGGILFFPPGVYKTTATLTFTPVLNTPMGGILVEGSGRSEQGNDLSSTIAPNFASGDVFWFKSQDSSNNYEGPYGVTVEHLFTDRKAAYPATSGATFRFDIAASVRIDDVGTWDDFDVIRYGKQGINNSGIMYVTNSSFKGIIHDFSRHYGITGGEKYSNVDAIGDSSVYAGAKTNTCFSYEDMAATDPADPIFINDVQCESFGRGFVATTGLLGDVYIDNLEMDGVSGAQPAFDVQVSGSGGELHRARIKHLWVTSQGEPALVLSSGGTQGTFSAGIAEVSIADSSIQGGSNSDIFVGDGATDVELSGIFGEGGSSSSCALKIGGSSTTSHVSVIGGHYGGTFGSDEYGVCIVPGASSTVTNVVFSGVDLTGNTTNALVADNSASGASITNLSVTGSNMSGYATPISFPGAPVGYLADNLGYNSASGAPSGSCPNGAVYTNASGGSGSTLYACYSNAWHAATTP